VIDPSRIKVLVADEADVLVGTGSLGEQTIGVKKYAPDHLFTLLVGID
jgi:hypothetical protein